MKTTRSDICGAFKIGSITLALCAGVSQVEAGDRDEKGYAASESPFSRAHWAGTPDAIDQGWFVPADSPLKNFYYGVGYGPVFTDLSDAYDDGSVTMEDKDDDGTAVSTFLGYNFNDYVGVEAGFTAVDDVEYSAMSDGSGDSWAAGSVSGKYEADLWSLYLVGRYPATDRLTLLIRLGIVHWDSKETYNEGGVISTDSDSGETVGVGGGFEYDIGKKDRIKLRGDLGYHSNNEDEIDVVGASVAIVYEFP